MKSAQKLLQAKALYINEFRKARAQAGAVESQPLKRAVVAEYPVIFKFIKIKRL